MSLDMGEPLPQRFPEFDTAQAKTSVHLDTFSLSNSHHEKRENLIFFVDIAGSAAQNVKLIPKYTNFIDSD